jgi:hypothetical protein
MFNADQANELWNRALDINKGNLREDSLRRVAGLRQHVAPPEQSFRAGILAPHGNLSGGGVVDLKDKPVSELGTQLHWHDILVGRWAANSRNMPAALALTLSRPTILGTASR